MVFAIVNRNDNWKNDILGEISKAFSYKIRRIRNLIKRNENLSFAALFIRLFFVTL